MNGKPPFLPLNPRHPTPTGDPWAGGLAPPVEFDEFGGAGPLAQVNRGVSLLVRRCFQVPATWEPDHRAKLRGLLAGMNQSGLAVLLLAGWIAAGLIIVFALQSDSTMPFLVGLAIIPAAFLVQYVLSLFCSANLRLSFGEPILLVSRLIPEAITVVGTLAVGAFFVGGAFVSLMAFSQSLWLGLASVAGLTVATFVSLWVPWLAANAEQLLNVRYRDDTEQGPGDYLCNLILFSARFQLMLVPLGFFVVTVGFFLAALGAGAVLILGMDGSALSFQLASASLISVLPIVIGLGLLPIAAHFLFLLTAGLAQFGSAFFRLVESSRRVTELSEEAMQDPVDLCQR